MLDLDIALERMLATLEPLTPLSEMPPDEAAGRYLARAVRARVAVPPFDNSAMDGYALTSSDPALAAGGPLRVSQRIFAGQPPGSALLPGHCARIFTGAPLPEGSDCVVAQEDARLLDDGRIEFAVTPARGRHVRKAGGDVAAGQTIAEPGDRITAARLALLTAAGIERVAVHPFPDVTVLTTGDELRAPGERLQPGQIHDANGPMLAALARQCGARVVHAARLGDDPTRLGVALADAAGRAHALICCGGMSVGEADHVRSVLEGAGEVAFWKLALKPGKPFAYGHFDGRPFFGLPGNPVSAMVTFLLLVRPALLRLAGARDTSAATLPAVLEHAARKTPGRRDFQRGIYRTEGNGEIRVRPLERQDSNILSSLTEANCLIDLPRESTDPPAGTRVRILPLPGARDQSGPA